MENNEQTENTNIWDISEEELTELITAIDRESTIKLVRSSSYLQRHVFRGFRPSHLPWNEVPAKLAHDAMDRPDKIGDLIKMWATSNVQLLNQVGDIAPDHLREGVAELLIQQGPEHKRQVLWALRLDAREEVRQALEQGLTDEILDEASDLLTQVRAETLTTSLETTQAEVSRLQKALVEAQSAHKDISQLLQRKNAQYEEALEKATALEAANEHLHVQIDERTHIQEELNHKLQQAQEKLEGVQTENAELHRSVSALRATLRTQAGMQSSKQEETQQQLNQTLVSLEDERRETARLRLRLDKAERSLEDVHAKRDSLQAHYEALEAETNKTKRAKEVLIEEKRKLTEQATQLQRDLDNARRQLREQVVSQVLETLNLPELDARWLGERETVRDFLQATIHTLTLSPDADTDASKPYVNKWGMWSKWLDSEKSYVQVMIERLEQDPGWETLENLQKAQQLLALRWYVLEYTRQVMVALLQESAFPL